MSTENSQQRVKKISDDIKQLVINSDRDGLTCFSISQLLYSLFASKGHILMYLPAYSPFLNPIENLFNQLKHHAKKFKPSTADDVFKAVELASEVITSTDCKHYFDHMMKYIPRCMIGEKIEN